MRVEAAAELGTMSTTGLPRRVTVMGLPSRSTFGLGRDDERVVFGATVLMTPYDRLPLPEMRNAARVVVPRIGAADCPVAWGAARCLIGSGDFEAIREVIPRLSEDDACLFLGALHRMVRPDAVPPLCELALQSDGAVRNAAFDDAELAVRYSEQHVPLLVETWLQLVGRTPEPEPEGHREGIPGTLAAALRAHLELPEQPRPAEGELDRRRAAFPIVTCARWLYATTPSVRDLPLLRELLDAPDRQLRETAAWAIGAVHDEAALRLLRDGQPDRIEEVVLAAARARNGDQGALARLLEADDVALCCGIALASPTQRRARFERFLSLSVEHARAIAEQWGRWAGGQEYDPFVVPPYDDRYFAELMPLVEAAHDLDARVLRLLVGVLPCFATERLAERLLTYPPNQLFATLPGEQEVDVGDGLWGLGPGHRGAWAFLEVTRGRAFGMRLREGLGSDLPAIRELCARLMFRIGDAERVGELVAWIDDAEGDCEDCWLDLARLGTPAVRQVLHDRLCRAEQPREVAVMTQALAVALGVPVELAGEWPGDGEAAALARDALLRGDVQRALSCAIDELDVRCLPALADWPDPALRAAARARVESCDEGVPSLFAFDRQWALIAGDRPEIDRCLLPIRDGRYATHDYLTMRFAARADGLTMLPFWIDQLGTNCCKVAEVEEVLERLFGRRPESYQRSKLLEPAGTCLRRTLLPDADRLRWSRIANGYVVAGR